MLRQATFTTKIMLLQFLVVIGVIALLLTVAVAQQRASLEREYEERAVSVARTLSVSDGLAQAVAGRDVARVAALVAPVGPRTGALYVVVTDAAGMRMYHPNPALIGLHVSTSADAALAGRDDLSVDTGTLGASARGKVPLILGAGTAGSRVVGEVSVGFSTQQITASLERLVWSVLTLSVFVLALGLLASYALSRYLKSRTLGLEPEQLAELVRDREAVLHAVREATLTFDQNGALTLANDHAQELVFAGQTPGGHNVPESIRRLVNGPNVDIDVQVLHDKLVLVSHRNVTRESAKRTIHLGSVVTVIDRSDVQALASELVTVKSLLDTLRAQRHEYANRTHLITAYLDAHDVAGALEFIRGTNVADAEDENSDVISDQTLKHYLGAKTALAHEKGIELRLSEGTYLPGVLRQHADVVTVLGNLIDNAVTAIAAVPLGTGGMGASVIEIDLLADGADLVLSVCDSGPGVPAAEADAIFLRGHTRGATGAEHYGLGLALARETARGLGGDLWLVPSDEPGCTFVARLKNVITEGGHNV